MAGYLESDIELSIAQTLSITADVVCSVAES